MEESKELQGFYRIFRAVVYVSVLLEFFEYAFDPAFFGDWGGILADIHGRIKRWSIYSDGNLVYSKLATVLLICITCIGTRNKKHLEFNAKRQVVLPLTAGLALLVLSVWLFNKPMGNPVHGRFARGRDTRACRPGQHLEVHQGRADERPVQF